MNAPTSAAVPLEKSLSGDSAIAAALSDLASAKNGNGVFAEVAKQESLPPQRPDRKGRRTN